MDQEQIKRRPGRRKIHRSEYVPGPYPSSLTDHEWEVLRPLVEHKGGRGRPVFHDRRKMLDAVFYLVRSGTPWRMLPADFPAYKAVFAFYARARDSGLLEQVYERLHKLWRERGQRDPLMNPGLLHGSTFRNAAEKGNPSASV